MLVEVIKDRLDYLREAWEEVCKIVENGFEYTDDCEDTENLNKVFNDFERNIYFTLLVYGVLSSKLDSPDSHLYGITKRVGDDLCVINFQRNNRGITRFKHTYINKHIMLIKVEKRFVIPLTEGLYKVVNTFLKDYEKQIKRMKEYTKEGL